MQFGSGYILLFFTTCWQHEDYVIIQFKLKTGQTARGNLKGCGWCGVPLPAAQPTLIYIQSYIDRMVQSKPRPKSTNKFVAIWCFLFNLTELELLCNDEWKRISQSLRYAKLATVPVVKGCHQIFVWKNIFSEEHSSDLYNFLPVSFHLIIPQIFFQPMI